MDVPMVLTKLKFSADSLSKSIAKPRLQLLLFPLERLKTLLQVDPEAYHGSEPQDHQLKMDSIMTLGQFSDNSSHYVPRFSDAGLLFT